MIGMNLDPSHLFWMGGDPIEAARVLGEHDAIYHIHGKDSRPERRYWQPNGMLDTKPIDAICPPLVELCCRRRGTRCQVVEGVFLGCPHVGLQR